MIGRCRPSSGVLSFNPMEDTKTLEVAKSYREQTDLCVFSSIQGFETAQRMANALSQSNIVPQNFQGNIGNCLIALDISARLGLSPLTTMNGLYVVKGKPAFLGQFVIALLNASGKTKTPLRYEFVGKEGEDSWGCRAYAIDLQGQKLYGPTVTIKTAKEEGWWSTNKKWQTMTSMMLRYRSGAWWVRTNTPELLLGFQTVEEVEDTEKVTIVDVPQHEIVEVDLDKAAPVEEAQVTDVKPAPKQEPIKPKLDF